MANNTHPKDGGGVTNSKPLPHRVYPRGEQGTFVYAPDIAVYVSTDEYGIIDLSPYITSFTIQRNVNAPSSFMCTFDNKFSKFDRVIRRMNRVVVFLKRINWVQTFAGYVSVAPWETVVPGDAMLQADCTLKRLIYTYWDPHSAEAQALFPLVDASSATTVDSGAAATLFKLLTTIAAWPKNQIQIQKIPEIWLTQALSIMQHTKDDQINDPDYQAVLSSLKLLLTADGWLGFPMGSTDVTLGDTLGINSSTKSYKSNNGGMAPANGVDQEWYKLVGTKGTQLYPPHFGTKPEYLSGGPNVQSHLALSGVYDNSNKPIALRPDAAYSLGKLSEGNYLKGFTITDSFISYDDQKRTITRSLNANNQQINTACANVPCPAGISPHGWGTAIDFDVSSPSATVMNQFGWVQVSSGDGGATNNNHWEFVGNYQQGYPAYVRASDKPVAQGRGSHVSYTNTKGQFDWQTWQNKDVNNNTASNAFKNTYFWPGPGDGMSNLLTGKRAWINDVPLIQSITDMAAAAMRDFQSGPNGDFVAFFPDRLGIYGKFAAMQVRDIEITNFNLIISDRQMVTHYVSVADMTNVDPQTGTDLDVFSNAGYVTVEQPEVMRLLLGLPQDQTPDGLGEWIMQRFGIRPRRDDNYDIWNPGYNYMIALHRFQEAWAAQWNAIVGFTFMPELFPGMRIELVNYNIGVYVEQITHSGTRTGGFTTTATVSSPMTKVNGEWKILSMEFDPAQFHADSGFANSNTAADAGTGIGVTAGVTGGVTRGAGSL